MRIDTQPYCLENGWIKNADTMEPVGRVDRLNGKTIVLLPGLGAITLDNVKHLVAEIEKER